MIGRTTALLLAVLLSLSGCTIATRSPTTTATANPTVAPTATPTPEPTATPTPPQVLSIEVLPDPSVSAADRADPYKQIYRYALEAYEPNRALYNRLYAAVDQMESEVDISDLDLEPGDISDAVNALYVEAQLRFYYFERAALRSDGKRVKFTYTIDDADEVRRNKETLYARLSHLLHNVATANFTDLQKTVAIYQALCEMADYSADMSDLATLSAYSILTNGQGICGGYAYLAHILSNKSSAGRYEFGIAEAGRTLRVLLAHATWLPGNLYRAGGNAGTKERKVRGEPPLLKRMAA